MAGSSENNVRVVSEDDFLYEQELRKRAVFRCFCGGLAIALGIILVVFAFFPLIAKSVIPLMWVQHANEFGWSKELQEIGIRLLANGRIEIMPIWVSYVLIVAGMFTGWIGVNIIRFRFGDKIMGDVLTKSYWLHFYWIKKPVSHISVSYQDLRTKKPGDK